MAVIINLDKLENQPQLNPVSFFQYNPVENHTGFVTRNTKTRGMAMRVRESETSFGQLLRGKGLTTVGNRLSNTDKSDVIRGGANARTIFKAKSTKKKVLRAISRSSRQKNHKS